MCEVIVQQFYPPRLALTSCMIGDQETGATAVVNPLRDAGPR